MLYFTHIEDSMKVIFHPKLQLWYGKMNNDILMDAGKTVISLFFERNEKHSMDDVEILPLVKDLINGISSHSNDAEKIREALFKFARSKYTDLCKKHQIEGGDEEDRLQENEEYFKYVYENEEHPR
jgi:hypothetical protein